jgi:hypothetical protein
VSVQSITFSAEIQQSVNELDAISDEMKQLHVNTCTALMVHYKAMVMTFLDKSLQMISCGCTNSLPHPKDIE